MGSASREFARFSSAAGSLSSISVSFLLSCFSLFFRLVFSHFCFYIHFRLLSFLFPPSRFSLPFFCSSLPFLFPRFIPSILPVFLLSPSSYFPSCHSSHFPPSSSLPPPPFHSFSFASAPRQAGKQTDRQSCLWNRRPRVVSPCGL